MVPLTIISYKHGCNAMVVGKYTLRFSRMTLCFANIYTKSHKLLGVPEFNSTTISDRRDCKLEFSYTTTTGSKVESQSSDMADATYMSKSIQHMDYIRSQVASIQAAHVTLEDP